MFQTITTDNWTVILFNIANNIGLMLPAIFSVTVVALGSFMLLNLMLAVIMEQYVNGENEETND